MLTLVTGGARSGKSRAAERLASAGGSIVTYVATATSVGPDGNPGPSLYCAVIVKQVDAQTRSKTSINDLLRD